MRVSIRLVCFCLLLARLSLATPSSEATPSSGLPGEGLELKQLDPVLLQLEDFDGEARQVRRRALAALGVVDGSARFDALGGRAAALWLRRPLLPGAGVDNTLEWGEIGIDAVPVGEALAEVAWVRLLGFLEEHAEALGIEPSELRQRVGVHSGGQLIQIHATRWVDGVRVRGAGLTATVNQGNLILLGLGRWGDVAVARRPALTDVAALDALLAYLGPQRPQDLREPAVLELVPTATEGAYEVGRGYRHRLVWVFALDFAGSTGRW